MKVSDLFEPKYGINLELNTCEITDSPDGINFVSRTSKNNGIVAKVKKIEGKEPQPAGVLTCACGGSVLSTFVQLKPFYSGRDLYLLIPKKEMSLEEKLFYCHAIKMNAYRYQYGRQANKTLGDIELPELPEWLKNTKIDYSKIKTTNNNPSEVFDTKGWKEFTFEELFEIEKGNQTMTDIDVGTIPVVSSSDSDNGVTIYTNDSEEKFSGNKITVAANGSVGSAFYQPDDFFATGDVNVLIPKFKLNKYIAMFIITVIQKEKYRFSYGRKWGKEKMLQSKIKLPPDENGNPNWQYMENYIKTFPYSDLI